MTDSRILGLRLGQHRSHALLSALLTFRTQFNGFTNADLRRITAELRGLDPATVTWAGKMVAWQTCGETLRNRLWGYRGFR